MIDKKIDYFINDTLSANLRERAVMGGKFSVISRILGYVIQMAGVIVLARLLNPEDFGLVAMVTVFTEIFYVLKDLGLSYATIQERNLTHEQVSTLFWINVTFGFFVTLLLIAISPAIAWFYKKPEVGLITIVSSVNFVLIGLSIQHLALLKRNMAFKQIAFIELLAAFISTSTAIFLAQLNWGYWSLVAKPIVLGIITVLTAWHYCRWRPGMATRNSGVGKLVKYGANTLGSYIFDYITLNIDKTLIGRRFGADQLGYYQRAVYLSKFASNSITISLTHVAVATLSKLRDEPERYRRYYLKAISVISLIGMPLSIFLFIMSKEIVFIILGPKWDQTAAIFSILGLSTGIYLISNTNGWLHLSLGRSDRLMRWAIVAALITLVAVLVGLRFGPVGVAIAYALATFTLTLPSLLYAGRPIKLGLAELISSFWKYAGAAVGAGVLCKYLLFNIVAFGPLLVRAALSSLIYAVLYIFLLMILLGGIRPIIEYVALFKGSMKQL